MVLPLLGAVGAIGSGVGALSSLGGLMDDESEREKRLRDQALGRGPSPAAQMLQSQSDDVTRQMMTQAAASRSNPALAMRNAALAASQQQASAFDAAGQARVREQQMAEQQLAGALQRRGQLLGTQAGTMGALFAGLPQVTRAVDGLTGGAPAAPQQPAPVAPAAPTRQALAAPQAAAPAAMPWEGTPTAPGEDPFAEWLRRQRGF